MSLLSEQTLHVHFISSTVDFYYFLPLTEIPGSPSVQFYISPLFSNGFQPHTDSCLDRQSLGEPLVVATQPELFNEPAHMLKLRRDDRAPCFRS